MAGSKRRPFRTRGISRCSMVRRAQVGAKLAVYSSSSDSDMSPERPEKRLAVSGDGGVGPERVPMLGGGGSSVAIQNMGVGSDESLEFELAVGADPADEVVAELTVVADPASVVSVEVTTVADPVDEDMEILTVEAAMDVPIVAYGPADDNELHRAVEVPVVPHGAADDDEVHPAVEVPVVPHGATDDDELPPEVAERLKFNMTTRDVRDMRSCAADHISSTSEDAAGPGPSYPLPCVLPEDQEVLQQLEHIRLNDDVDEQPSSQCHLVQLWLRKVKAGGKGNLSVIIEILQVAPSLYMVESRKEEGDTLEFHEFYKNLSKTLNEVAWKSDDLQTQHAS